MKSMQEQKMALAAYAAENSSIQQLSSHQLDLLKKCNEVLNPIEEITRSISADLASISIVIPYICILTRTLQKTSDDSGIRTMKAQLLHSLKSGFSGIEENKELSLATILDPRFKDKFFSGNIIQATIKEMLVEEMSTFTIDVQNTEPEGPTRPKRLCPLNSSVLLDVFSEIVAESNEEQSMPTSEVERYLGMAIIDFKVGDPFYGGHNIVKNFQFFQNWPNAFYLHQPPRYHLRGCFPQLEIYIMIKETESCQTELLFMQNNFILVGTVYHFK